MAGRRERLTPSCAECDDSEGAHRRLPDGTRTTCTLPARESEGQCPCPGFRPVLAAAEAMAEGARLADVRYTRRH
jgi:hypothetical protein